MAMGKSSRREKHLARQVSFALAVGLFGALSKAHGMPVLDHKPDTVGIHTSGAVMGITGQKQNNVIHWKDFSVAGHETVNFDGKNYMNVVTGQATSMIDGALKNQGGDLYIINQNGVIFGKGAHVDVGNLYVSTRNDADGMVRAFEAGQSGSAVLQAGGALNADVVSLMDNGGRVEATQVVMEGSTIRFLNAEVVDATKENFVLRADTDGYIHVGARDEATALSKFTGYIGNGKDRAANDEIAGYTLIHNASEWNNIYNDLSGNYMLADDIDFKGNTIASVGNVTASDFGAQSGTSFKGNFDGMKYKIHNFNITNTGKNAFAGLFAYTENARIENVGIENATITGTNGGGLVGYAKQTTLRNVWNSGKVHTNNDAFRYLMGGIVGVLDNSTLTNAYNTGEITGGGLVGGIGNGSTISDAYNMGQLTANRGQYYGIFAYEGNNHYAVDRTYTASGGAASDAETIGFGGSGNIQNSYVILAGNRYRLNMGDIQTASSSKNEKNLDFYANWGNAINNDGTSNTTWRIYENESLPLLTAFFKGTVSVDYAYATETKDNIAVSGGVCADGAKPSKTYDGTAVSPSNVRYSFVGQEGVVDSSLIDISDNKDAKTFALFSSGQQGYNIIGGNFTIDKRKIKLEVENGGADKVYDGSASNVISGDALKGKFVNSENSALPGVLAGDLASVQLTGTVSYTYVNPDGSSEGAANVGDKKVTVTAQNLSLTNSNYELETKSGTLADGVDAKITPRSVVVSLEKDTDLNRVYDGKADVRTPNNIKHEVDYSGLSEAEIETLKQKDSALSLDSLDKVTGWYVKDDGTTAAVNVADTANDQNKHVAYVGLDLKNNDKGNYKLVDQDGNDLQSVTLTDANGQTLTDQNGNEIKGLALMADGKITKRNISSNGFQIEGEVTKFYDGSSEWSGGEEKTVDAQGAGVLDIDKDKLKFVTTGKVVFYDKNGHETADATDSGLATAAKKVKFQIGLADGCDETALGNYTVDDKDLTLASTFDGGTGKGTIKKRTITVGFNDGKGTKIDKEYDGTDDVAAGRKTVGADGEVWYSETSKQLVGTDGTQIEITAAKYQAGHGVEASDVAWTSADSMADENVAVKDISYTVAITGDKAANYDLNTTGSTTATLNATGKITPVDLDVEFSKVEKTYDGTADVAGDTIRIASIVGAKNKVDFTEKAEDIFDVSQIQGLYGSLKDKVFDANADAGDKDVQYTGSEGNLQSAITSRNYRVSNTVYGKGIILKKTLTSSDLQAATEVKTDGYPPLQKDYDGKTTDTKIKGTDGLSYLQFKDGQTAIAEKDKDTLKFTIDEAVYEDKNAGGNKNVSLIFIVTGTGAGNYEFAASELESDGSLKMTQTGYTGTITPKTVTVTLTGGNPTKVYDATTALVDASGKALTPDDLRTWFALGENDIVEADRAFISIGGTITGQYADANAGQEKVVTYEGIELVSSNENSPVSNYTFKQGENKTVTDLEGVGTINTRTIWVESVSGNADKTYDGSADVKDSVKLTIGNDIQNNVFTEADGALKSEYSGKLAGLYQSMGEGNDAADVWRDAAGNAQAKDIIYTGLAGIFGDNYEIKVNDYYDKDGQLHYEGTIRPQELDLSQITLKGSVTDEYHGNASVTDVTKWLDGLGGSDDVFRQVLNIQGTFCTKGTSTADKNAGDKTVIFTITMKQDTDHKIANNFDIKGDGGSDTKELIGEGKITPKEVTVSLTAEDTTQKEVVKKTYDGTTAATGDVKSFFTLEGVLDGEDVTLDTDALLMEYENKNAGYERKVYYGGFQLQGTAENPASNYSIVVKGAKEHEFTTDGGPVTKTDVIEGVGTIKQRVISVSFLPGNGIEKTYDGTADVTKQPGEQGAFDSVWEPEDKVNERGLVGKDVLEIAGQDGAALKGLYGTWDPMTGAGAENAHVQRDAAGNVIAQDVGYFGLVLQGADADNYTLDKDFDIAPGKGKILPRKIDVDDVQVDQNSWKPVEKVYDGTTAVQGGFTSGGDRIDDLSQYFKIVCAFEDDQNILRQIDLDYTVDSAYYAGNANAGEKKDVIFTGLKFSDTTWGDFTVDRSALENKFKEVEGEGHGTILRRLLDVSAGHTAMVGGDNTKIYDGNRVLIGSDAPYVYDKDLLKAAQNDPVKGIVGNDNVSVTYTANFNDSNANIDPDVKKDGAGWTTKDVTYTFTLSGDAANYTLTKEGQADWSSDRKGLEKQDDSGKGAIRRREVYVDFANGGGTGLLDKTYDGKAELDLTEEQKKALLHFTAETVTNAETGKQDDVQLKYDDVTLTYVDANGKADGNVAVNGSGDVTTKKVYVQNFTLDGEGADNYYVKVKDSQGNLKDGKEPLEGSGTISRKTVEVSFSEAEIKKEYDRTANVRDYTEHTDAEDILHPYLTDNIITNGVLTKEQTGRDEDDDLKLEVLKAVYVDPATKQETFNASDRDLGVDYYLKWDNQNYELVRVPVNPSDGVSLDVDVKHGTATLHSDKGRIEKRKLTYNANIAGVDKEYDGTTKVLDTSVADAIFSNVIDADKPGFLTVTSGGYQDADTGADKGAIQGVGQTFTIGFALSENAAKNYVLWSKYDTDQVKANDPVDGASASGTYTGFGHINRRKVTLTPDCVGCYPDELPAAYTGSVSGLGGLSLPDGLVLTWGRAPAQDGVAAGLYPLYGYVDGALVPVGYPYYYYNDLRGGLSGNFYFETAPNQALEILAQPVQPDLRPPEHQVIADIQFTPDDLSYNRGAMDPDGVHFGYLPEAELRYTGGGVRAEDAEGSLFSDALLSGRGDIVNLDGAAAWTPQEAAAWTPEEAAAEAAQPMDEAFGMELVNEDSEKGSMSMLDILTRASEKRTRGQGIVIDAMDEDEEEEEEQRKARGMMMANRANIGIEASGDGVNLDALLG